MKQDIIAEQHHLRQQYAYYVKLQKWRVQLRKTLPTEAQPVRKTQWQHQYDQLLIGNEHPTWTPQHSIDHDIVSACLWGTANATAVLEWLRMLTWQTNPSPGDRRLGTTWYELCYAYLNDTHNPLAINIGDTGKSFLPKLCFPTDADVDFSPLIYAFERMVTQLQQLTSLPWVPSNRATVMSLTVLGNSHGGSGIPTECFYASKQAVCTQMCQHFLWQAILKVPRSQRFPGYTSDRTSNFQLDDTNRHDLLHGWQHRFSKYTRMRKAASRRQS